jgi:hypothetical protein
VWWTPAEIMIGEGTPQAPFEQPWAQLVSTCA